MYRRFDVCKSQLKKQVNDKIVTYLVVNKPNYILETLIMICKYYAILVFILIFYVLKFSFLSHIIYLCC